MQVSSSFWAAWSSAESQASSFQPQAGAERHVAASWGKSMLWGHFRRHAAQVIAYLDLHSQAVPTVVFSLSHQLREGKVSQWVSELNMGVRASRWQGSCDNRSWKCPIFMKPELNSMKWPTKVYVMFPAPALAAEAWGSAIMLLGQDKCSLLSSALWSEPRPFHALFCGSEKPNFLLLDHFCL